MFLIYPYWNVNNNLKDLFMHTISVSNLSILECKSTASNTVCNLEIVSNLSILECKLQSRYDSNYN